MWMRWNGCLKTLPSLRLGVVPMSVVKGLAFGRLSTSGSTSTVEDRCQQIAPVPERA
jgi:hypothetical protein